MHRTSTCLLVVVAWFGVSASAHAAAVAAQEQGQSARLLAADVGVRVASPAAGEVDATFQVEASGDLDILLVRLPGQRTEGLAFVVDGEPARAVQMPRSSALVAYRLSPGPGAHEIRVTYAVISAAPTYRFVLPVPEATPDGEQEVVRLRVLLPAGSEFRGNSFPPLRRSEVPDTWATSSVALSSFVHVVFGDAGWSLWAHRVVEWTALLVALLLLLGGWVLARRRPEAVA